MRFVADLHIHSPYSIATSKHTLPATLYRWARLKGIVVVATGDFTHPEWRARLKAELEPAEAGLFRLREDLAKRADTELPASCRGEVRFMLSAEISNIYKRAGKTRKVHNLVYVPSFEEAESIAGAIEAFGARLESDGRPISKMDSEDLLRYVGELSPEGFLVPAHVWTPHFSVFGAFNRFSTLEECYGAQTGRIFALETGLSSDPPMNWRLSQLDGLTLVSNSDSHSPRKLGREATLFDAPLSFGGIRDAIRDADGVLGTIEFFPEEGKYHLDGHRACKQRLTPEQAQAAGGLCPACGRKITVGVMHRVAELADRKRPRKPKRAAGFESLVGLESVLSEILGAGVNTKTVQRAYLQLVGAFGGELPLLRETPLDAIAEEGPPALADAVRRIRRGKVFREPGYDGEYGKVRVFDPEKAAAPS